MKSILVLSMLFSITANAAGTLYCKVNGRAVDALTSEDPSWSYNEQCQTELLTGEVCFTGSRTEIIERLNSKNRVGSDEEWIEDARFYGENLHYTVVDGPNEESYKHVIKRCTKNFFASSTPEQLPLFPDIELKKDVDALRAYLTIEDVGNGDADVSPYHVDSLETVVKDIIQSELDSARLDQRDAPIITTTLKNAASELKYWIEENRGTPENVEEAFAPLLERMIEKKVVLKILSIAPPESCEESEYCSYHTFHIFLSTGEHFYIHFDFNT